MSRRESAAWGLAAVVLSLAWNLATPAWQGPDEPSHYAMAQWLAHHRSLPVFRQAFGFSEELRGSIAANDLLRIRFHPEEKSTGWTSHDAPAGLSPRASAADSEVGNSAASYPPLYYLPAAAIERFCGDLDISTRLRIARLLNLFWVFAYGFYAFRAAGRVLPQSLPAARALAATIVAWPQIVFMSGVFSPDVALAAAYAWALDRALAILDARRLERPFLAGLVAGSCLLLKQTAGWIPVSLGAMTLVMAIQARGSQRGARLREFLVLAIVSGAVTAPWIHHCIVTYGSINPWTFKAESRLALSEALRLYFTLTSPTAQFGQFLGRFGWLDARIPLPLEAAVAAAAALGLAHSAWTQGRNPAWWTAVLVGVGGVAFTAVGMVTSGMASGFFFSPAGRYYATFIAALVPTLWAGPIAAAMSSRFSRPLAGILVALPFCINLYACIFVLVPRYHG